MDVHALLRHTAGCARTLADRWLPRSCALCDATLAAREAGLCAVCLQALAGLQAPRCGRCGLLAPAPVQACSACTRAPPAFDRTLVLADYAPPLDRLVQALKFRGELALAGALGSRMAPLLAPLAHELDALVPVPLAAGRIAGRGFNQSAAIAGRIAGILRVRVRTDLLTRERETPAQSGLALAGRLANLDGAFQASPAADGLRVALVDDVMTSGATLEAAARALKAAGAASVVNLVAARTP